MLEKHSVGQLDTYCSQKIRLERFKIRMNWILNVRIIYYVYLILYNVILKTSKKTTKQCNFGNNKKGLCVPKSTKENKNGILDYFYKKYVHFHTSKRICIVFIN